MYVQEERPMDEIVPRLWMGGYPDWKKLVGNFDAVVSCSRMEYPIPVKRFIHMPFDDVDEVINGDEIRETAAKVANWHRKGYKVFVHCDAGLNRSGIVVARALMFLGMPVNEAILRMRKQRGEWVLFNVAFERWLRAEAESP